MNNEQLRAEFEAWLVVSFPGIRIERLEDQRYVSLEAHFMFEAYQAGRAALQSQDRGYAVERLIEAVRNYMSFGCPVCSGDCFSANPPVSGCPAREAQEAIDHARRGEGGGE